MCCVWTTEFTRKNCFLDRARQVLFSTQTELRSFGLLLCVRCSHFNSNALHLYTQTEQPNTPKKKYGCLMDFSFNLTRKRQHQHTGNAHKIFSFFFSFVFFLFFLFVLVAIDVAFVVVVLLFFSMFHFSCVLFAIRSLFSLYLNSLYISFGAIFFIVWAICCCCCSYFVYYCSFVQSSFIRSALHLQ